MTASLAGLLLATVAQWHSPARVHAAPEPLARCEKTKLLAAGKAAASYLKCHSRAAKVGEAVDAGCVAKAATRMADAFSRAESADAPCPFTGERATVEASLQSSASALASTQTPGSGASACGARKLKAAGKRSSKRLKAEAKHALAPERDKLAPLVAKLVTKFDRDVVKAESFGDCTAAGDGATLTASADALVADVLDPVRGNLATLGAALGRRVGAAVRANVLAAMEPEYRAILARHFSQITVEYELMWGNVEPVQGVLDLAPVETTLSFAEDNGLPVVGIPLVWHLILPPWVNDSMTPVELQAAVDTRIDDLVGGYAGRIGTWIVVNEAVNAVGTGMQPSIFLDKLGPDYVADAFHRARQADPDALLFYNDFLAEGLGQKSDFIYDMIVDLLAQGVPIDGVGFQTHLGGSFSFFGIPLPSGIQANLQRFADLGLRVAITEMDVQLNGLGDTHAERLARQRAVYHDVLAACVAVTGCESLSFWGLTDRHTWINDFLFLDDAPLPWDTDYFPKAAFFGVRDALLAW